MFSPLPVGGKAAPPSCICHGHIKKCHLEVQQRIHCRQFQVFLYKMPQSLDLLFYLNSISFVTLQSNRPHLLPRLLSMTNGSLRTHPLIQLNRCLMKMLFPHYWLWDGDSVEGGRRARQTAEYSTSLIFLSPVGPRLCLPRTSILHSSPTTGGLNKARRRIRLGNYNSPRIS